MSTLALAARSAAQVLLVGLVLGAGLPALFALGVRSLALADRARDGGDGTRALTHRALAGAAFAVVVLAVGLGLLVIVASGLGRTLVLDGLWPSLPKKGH